MKPACDELPRLHRAIKEIDPDATLKIEGPKLIIKTSNKDARSHIASLLAKGKNEAVVDFTVDPKENIFRERTILECAGCDYEVL
jgi:hypothetical protein